LAARLVRASPHGDAGRRRLGRRQAVPILDSTVTLRVRAGLLASRPRSRRVGKSDSVNYPVHRTAIDSRNVTRAPDRVPKVRVPGGGIEHRLGHRHGEDHACLDWL
jgi:hypothetical protein